MLKTPIVLLILDGWGIGNNSPYNAIQQANPRNFTYLWNHFPHTLLQASGPAVGLPSGYMGNSEVGHLTIGAGKIIPHMLVRISSAFAEEQLAEQEKILATYTATNNAIHLIGLLSDGGVHSHTDHLYQLIKRIRHKNRSQIFIHAILDGRDTAPNSGKNYLAHLEEFLQTQEQVYLASVAGRWYAMDRDENWERTAAYANLLTDPNIRVSSYQSQLTAWYDQKKSDEHFPPIRTVDRPIHPGETILFFNYRADRMRQIVSWLSNYSIPTKKRSMPAHQLPGSYQILTMSKYHQNYPFAYLFEPIEVQDTVFERLHAQGLRTCAIAETEKYAHVTYFFNGGREKRHPLEKRILIPSQTVDQFDQCPAMSAREISQALIQELNKQQTDVYVVNLANADMVGHTGNFTATVEAIKVVDEQIGLLYQAVSEQQGTLIITADHGNAEQMWDEQHQVPNTAHTTNPVPLIVTDYTARLEALQGIADIAQLFT